MRRCRGGCACVGEENETGENKDKKTERLRDCHRNILGEGERKEKKKIEKRVREKEKQSMI